MSTPAPLPIYDRLAKIAEAHYPKLLEMIDRAQLFLFPGKPDDILPKSIPKEETDLMYETFFLPFSTVAVEDNATCTILMDAVEDQTGFQQERYYLDCCPVFASSDNFNDDPDRVAEIVSYQRHLRERGVPKDTCVVSVGRLTEMKAGDDETKVWIAGSLDLVFMASKKEVIIPPMHDPKDEGLTAAGLRHARAAVEEVMYFNQPSRFICERAPHPKGAKKKTKHGEVKRSYSRPIYTALTPREIQEKFEFTDEQVTGGGKKRPHWRRRHKRMLNSDYYKNMKGKTVTVKAHWVGPEEAEVKGHHWRVRLDL